MIFDIVLFNFFFIVVIKYFIFDDIFFKMKFIFIFINIVWGFIVDEVVFVWVFELGKIVGCGLDVYENEL